MATRIDFSKLSLMDALDLAGLIEIEAFQRYELFSEQIGHRNPGDAASMFRSMAVNERKHAEQIAKRRLELFGDAPPKVTLDDIFDVEAPDVGSPNWNMSALKALEVALASEKKAFAFYDEALPSVKQKDVKSLFLELRDEESEHIQMVEEIIAKLPPEAALDVADADAD